MVGGARQRELRCILMTAWDPIRVGDAAEAWDEYDEYRPALLTGFGTPRATTKLRTR